MTTPNVVIIMAKCSQSKQNFGIRMEKTLTGQWMANWAFAIKEAKAKRESYDKSDISGSFLIDNAYPGCPHCEQSSFVKCGVCQKVSVKRCLAEVSRVALIPILGVKIKPKLVVTLKA